MRRDEGVRERQVYIRVYGCRGGGTERESRTTCASVCTCARFLRIFPTTELFGKLLPLYAPAEWRVCIAVTRDGAITGIQHA